MMVQQLKEDQAGKTEEELSECFRIFDKYDIQHWQKDKYNHHVTAQIMFLGFMACRIIKHISL